MTTLKSFDFRDGHYRPPSRSLIKTGHIAIVEGDHAHHGRYSLLHCGLLDITASLDAMDWILLFHASVFKGLKAGGMVISRREAQAARHGIPPEGPVIEARFQGEIFKISFSQGYRRVTLSAQELARKKKEISWAREYENRPSEKLTFNLIGTECRARKSWVGTQEKLQEMLPEIVQTAFQLVPLQVEMRKQREAAALAAERQLRYGRYKKGELTPEQSN